MGRRRPPCPSGKQRYPDRRTARHVLGEIRARKRGRTKVREEQAYECPRCGGWHLSSTKPKPNKPEGKR
jgi:hypothetical protein